MQERKRFRSDRVIALAVSLIAIAGWGGWIYSALDADRTERQLRGQVSALLDYQSLYASQRKAVEDGERQIAQLTEQLSSARSELERQTAKYKQTESELAKARDRLAALDPILRAPAVGSAPELLRITPLPTKEDVKAAQEALTQLRFGTINANGVMGASTRQAIEEFQRTVGLPVTGELQPQTLQALMRAAKVIAAQAEKAR